MLPGDFLSLLPPPAAVSAEVAAGKGFSPLHATTVFAFHCAEGVLLAGDHRATAGNVIFSDRTEKILELDRHSALAIAGSPAVAFEMVRTLRTAFEFYRRSQLQPMSLPAKVRALSRLLRENVPAALQGIGLVAPIFAGSEKGGRPQIFFHDPMGAEFEATSHAASGSGSGSIRSVLHYLETWGRPRPAEMSLDQAVVLALRLLITAAEFDAATGGVHPEANIYATLKLLTPEGVREIDRERQAAAWKEATRSP